MEDGSGGVSSSSSAAAAAETAVNQNQTEPNNGKTVMANFPIGDQTSCSSPLKVNGDSASATTVVTPPDDAKDTNSSDCDALVIDEPRSPTLTKIKEEQKEEEEEVVADEIQDHHQQQFTHTNPYFSESIFELSSQYNKPNPQVEDEEDDDEELTKVSTTTTTISTTTNGKKVPRKKHKLREYAQYLGLQPTVQFKCSKCGSAGFPSLQVLNEHLVNCTSRIPLPPPVPASNNATNFRVTRKVFLCSACGTYYENWNLFLHMREVHKRFICLYCLGMFPHAEKLSLHLVSKHNCAPGRFETVKDFFGAYKEPCFLMCCDCQTVFNEQEDFSNHICIDSNNEPPGDELKQQRLLPVVEENNSSTTAVAAAATTTASTNCAINVNETETTMVIDQQAESSDQTAMEVDERKEVVEKAPEVMNGDVDNSCAEERPKVKDEKCDENVEEGEDDNATVEDNDNIERTGPENDDVEENEEEDDGDNQEDMDVDDAASGRSSPADEDEEEAAISPPASPGEPEPEVSVTDERKVPKVTLKLPKITNYSSIADDEEEEEEEYDDEDDQSDDSEKLTMEVDKSEEQSDVETSGDPSVNATPRDQMQQPPDDDELEDDTGDPQDQSRINGADDEQDEKSVVEEEMQSDPNSIPTAGSDIAIIELELEQPLDKFDIRFLLQKCLKATVATCLYCNHARRIAVNGKQLGLHAISDHRFSAIVKSITAEELIPESFNNRIKECFGELENIYFSLESTFGNECVTYSHMFECFQCRYSTSVHKELYLHNRKLHAKAILLCTMCKTSFYSYSELICHLCPGLYVLESEVQFRCCLCVSDDLPSAFRLMVHLRKRHHVCDVCLEMCHNQSRLSNHIWKHKLHHLCYRCGISYRNKPDITKHLYWKHGTESVLCKKCQQKKWPHVYHFCIPPTSFTCEECNLSFSKAVRLMVHKRQHENNFPHVCAEEDCTEKFISKKLLEKHSHKHREPVKEEDDVEDDEEPDVGGAEKRPGDIGVKNESQVELRQDEPKVESENQKSEEPNTSEVPKPTKVDVYDLPELNLSESDSSESEEEDNKSKPTTEINATNTKSSFGDDDLDALILTPQSGEVLKTDEDGKLNGPVPILENVWDDFKNYQANIAKLDILTDVGKEEDDDLPKILTDIPEVLTVEVALRDHDYCAPTMDTLKEEEDMFAKPTTSVVAADTSADHDYCTAQVMPNPEPPKPEPEQKGGAIATKPPPSSDSSSDSDSSSCTCGSNCSCSSSSDSSSSSSDSSESDSSSEEGRRRQQVRRERRRQKKTKQQKSSTVVQEQKPAAAPTTVPEVAPKPKVVVPKKDIPIMESDLETTESDTDEDFYDKEPQKLANKMLAEKRERMLQLAGIGPFINGSMIDSRPSTPSLPPEEVKVKKSKSKSKKKKKKKSSRHEQEKNTMLTLTIPKHSPSYASSVYNNSSPNIVSINNVNNSMSGGHALTAGVLSETDSNTRASKRRRVPNKFYGYSSDEETEKAAGNQGFGNFKFRKVDLPSPVVPPITIKAPPPQTVEPISIRMTPKSGEMRVQPLRLPFPKIARTGMPRMRKPQPLAVVPAAPPLPPVHTAVVAPNATENSDSNSSSSEDETVPTNVVKEQPALYCYCRCPYDEVSEMIGCDADDCAIEWFHFECVGIMVPPKGQWYCPDCRKKKQQRRDMQHSQMSS